MAEQSNSSSNSVKVFNENDNQENSLLHTNNKSTSHLKGNPNVQGFGDKLGLLATPRAKNVLTNRKVLADKTPNNIKRPLQSTVSATNTLTSPTKSSSAASSPSLLLNNVITTPLQAHPSLRDVADSVKTLKNPPDLFLQPAQKRRSIRNRVVTEDSKDEIVTPSSSKLASVFPSTSDELDLDEIEHASSSLPNHNDDDAEFPLYGESTVIPTLKLHENIDFSRMFKTQAEQDTDRDENTFNTEIGEKLVIIEPIIVDFKADAVFAHGNDNDNNNDEEVEDNLVLQVE